MQSSKGQITIFVIIAIVLLIGALLFIFLGRENPIEETDEFLSDVTQVDTFYQPIQAYVQECMSSVGEEGLRLLGQGGGYIYPLRPDSNYNLFYDEIDIYRGDGVLLAQDNEDSFVPYWYHSITNVESSTLTPQFSMPAKTTMQNQLENYIDEHLFECINNFESLPNSQTIINITQPVTQVLFTEENVLVKTYMETEVSLDGTQNTKIETYFTPIEIPFLNYYYKASHIAIEESQNQFLENLLVDLISYYGRIDYDALPPIAALDTKASNVVWTQDQVNMRFKSLLQSYVPLFRIANTKNGFVMDVDGSEIEQSFYNSFLLPLFETDNPTLEVSFIYLNWPIYTKVYPTDGTLIAPNIVPDDFPMSPPGQENDYSFFYDISYPVIVELRETESQTGEDFVFMFAMEGNLKKNKNWIEYQLGMGPMPWTGTEFDIEIPGLPEEDYDPVSETMYQIPQGIPSKVLFGEGKQHLSGNISLTTYDAITGEPLTGVSVSGGVGVYAKSYLGQTTLTSRGDASFSSTAPLFENGFIILKKAGYATYYHPLSTQEGVDQNLGRFGLLQEKEQQSRVQVLEYIPNEDSDVWMQKSFTNMTQGRFILRELEDNESVYMTLSKIQSGTDLTPYSRMLIFEGPAPINETLIPGRFAISGTLIDDEGVIIPEKSKKVCDTYLTCLFIDKDERWVPEEPVELKPAMWGGVSIDARTPWSILGENLYDDGELVFTVLKFPPPESFDSLSEVGDLETYTNKLRTNLTPQFVFVE